MSKLKCYMFQLFGNKKAAREILNMAANSISPELETHMCPAINQSILRYFNTSKITFRELRRYSYTRENYHSFINKHFPELSPLLKEQNVFWINTQCSLMEKVIESKKAFLKHLANEI